MGMAEYIERESLIEVLRKSHSYHARTSRDSSLLGRDIRLVKEQPAADVVEVVHGRWIPIIDEPTPLRKMPMLSGYRCSVCGRYEEKEEPYCNCGAKMDGERKDNGDQ